MLESSRAECEDGRVSDGEDLVSRARSIFARLRDDAERQDDPGAEASTNGTTTPGPQDAPDVDEQADRSDQAAVEYGAEPIAEISDQEADDAGVEGTEARGDPHAAAAPPVETPVEAPVEASSPDPGLVAVVPEPQAEEPALPERLVDPDEIAEPAAVVAESDTAAVPKPPRVLPRVLAVANQKGGVGKTTTAVNLGASLAELGYRVLVVDLDPQGNATTGLGINPRNVESSIYDVIMTGTAIEDAIEPTAVRNLFVVPATIDLAGAEIELVPAFSRELKLRRALDDAAGDFDFTLIDCPPSLGLLTVNGLAAATEVLVPIQCEYYALEGLGQLLKNVSLVQNNLNPRLEVSAIVLTMYDARTRLAEQVASEVREHFGEIVCRNIVPRTVRLSEAPSFGQPVIVFDSSSRGAIAYRELAKEVSGGAPQRTG